MKRYVLGLGIAAAASAVALIFVMLFINPFTTGWLGVALLSASLFILLVSVGTLVIFVWRVWRSGKEVIYANLGTALRQGLLLGLVVTGSLVLQVFRLFNVWSALLFVAAVVLVELAFQSHVAAVIKREREDQADPFDPSRALRDIRPRSTSGNEPWHHRFNEKNET